MSDDYPRLLGDAIGILRVAVIALRSKYDPLLDLTLKNAVEFLAEEDARRAAFLASLPPPPADPMP